MTGDADPNSQWEYLQLQLTKQNKEKKLNRIQFPGDSIHIGTEEEDRGHWKPATPTCIMKNQKSITTQIQYRSFDLLGTLPSLFSHRNPMDTQVLFIHSLSSPATDSNPLSN